MDSTASLTSFEFENSQSPSAKRPLKKRRRTIEALKGYSNRGEAPQASVEAEAEEVGSSHRLRQAGRVRRLKDLVDNSQSEKKGRDSKNNGSNAEFLQETTDDSIKDQDQAAAPRRLRQDRQRRRTQDFVTKYRNSVTSEHEVENEHVDERDATEDSVQDPEEPAASLRRLRSSKQRRRTEDFVAKYSSVRSAEELEKGNTDEKEVTEDSLKHQEESAVSLRRLRRANRRRTQDFVDKYRNVEPSVTRRDHEKNREPSNEDTDSLISHQEEPAASHRFLRRSSRRQTQDYVDKYHNVEPVEKSLFKNAVPSLDISEESINCQVEPEASPRLLRSRRQRRTQDHVDKYRGVEPVEEEDHEATLEPSPLVVHAKNARARSGHSTVDVAPLYRGVSLDTSRMTVQTTSASFFQREPLVTSTPMAHTRNARASTSEVETHQQLEQQHYEDDRQEHGDNGQEDEDNEHRENGVVGNVSLLAESDGKGCDYYKGMGFEAAFRRFLADKEIGQDRQQAVDEVLRLPEATQLDDNVFKRPCKYIHQHSVIFCCCY